MSKVVGWNITIRTYIEYDVAEDSRANNKTPEQLIAEVKAMSKGEVLDVLDSLRGISVVEAQDDDVTVKYYEG